MAKSKANNSSPVDPVEQQLESIKRLLALFLMKTGVSQDEIALALQTDQGTISRMIPRRKIKTYDLKPR
jgi:predicted transcriptional regulator